ncbi:MAG: MFS transporter [Caldilineaceae bacterium]|nr:MFS transporter [Caldilineaceae bacterium]
MGRITWRWSQPPLVQPQGSSSRLWVAKLYYFLFFGALAGLVPYFNVYLEQQGLSGAEIGLIGSIPPLIALVSNPFWGAVADRWQIHQQVLALCALGAGLLSLAFLWTTGFWPLLLLVNIMIFFRAPVPALVDSAVMAMVNRTGAAYGRQRLFGSLGFVLFSFGLGQVLVLNEFSIIFWLHGLIIAVGCSVLSLLLPMEKLSEPPNLLRGLQTLGREPTYVSFLTMNVLMGAGAAGFINFVGLHILDIGGTQAQVGVAFALNAAMEVPIMFMSGVLLAHFPQRRLILVGLLGFVAVYFSIGLASSPLLILIFMPLLGFFYAAYWVAVVTYANRAAPPGMQATVQSLVAAAQGGLGWALGSIVAGLLWDAAGGAAVMFAAAAMMLSSALVFWIGRPGWKIRPAQIHVVERNHMDGQ